MMDAAQLRRGHVINLDGQLVKVVELSLLTPGNKRSLVQTQLKNLKTGQIVGRRFRSNDKVETAFLDTRVMEYLYSAGTEHVFMDVETLDQIPVAEELLENALNYILPNTRISIQFYENNPISVELPTTVNLKVAKTDPAVKGQTATNQYKSAELETGLKISVPPFLQEGDIVKVDTRTGEYLSRA